MGCGFVLEMNLREQTDAGLFGGKSNEKLLMIQELQARFEAMRVDIASLQTNMAEMQQAGRTIDQSSVRNLTDRIDRSDVLITQMRHDSCTRVFLTREIGLFATLLRREVFDHYEDQPDIVKRMDTTKPSKKLPSLEATLMHAIKKSVWDASGASNRNIAASEGRSNTRITDLQHNSYDLGQRIVGGMDSLSSRVLAIENAMRAQRPKLLPGAASNVEIRLVELQAAVDKLQADPNVLAAWKVLPWQKKTAVPEDTTVLDKIEHMDRNMLNVMHDLDNIKTAMDSMDDRLHALENSEN